MARKNGELPKKALEEIEWAAKVRDYPGATPHRPQATPKMVAGLTRLREAFRAEFGWAFRVNSAYRPLAVQTTYYLNRGKDGWPKLAARPGTSVHGWGLAVDIGGLEGFGSKQYAWLEKNAGRYGFWQPPQYRRNGSAPEYWHWEYRGGRDRYRRRKIALTGSLDKATIWAVGRAVNRKVISSTATPAFWRAVQRKVNAIMLGEKGWKPLRVDGDPGPKTWEGVRLSVRKVNLLHKPGKRASRKRVIKCWQRALNAGKRNGWSQKRSKYHV